MCVCVCVCVCVSVSTYVPLYIHHMFLFLYTGDDTADGGASNQLCAGELSVPQGKGEFFLCSQTIRGRYVFVRIPGRKEWLTLCEVEVY